MLYTTLKLLRDNSACSLGMETLTASLPKNQKDDKPISLAHILKSNGLDHALWALRATTVDSRKVAAHLAIEFAYPVLPLFEKQYPEDLRPRKALEAASAFLDGKITLQELEAASGAASRAASRASWASRAASRASEAADWASWASWASRASRAASRASWAASWASRAASRTSRTASRTSRTAQEKMFLKYMRKRQK
jgi:hypothetical protein